MASGAGGKEYLVQAGDTVPSVAAEAGFRSWETIWYHGKNAALRELRADPGVLYPGDRLWLPAVEPRDFNRDTNKRHTFKVKALKAYLELVLEDAAQRPYASAPYKVVLDGALTLTGTTDAEGYFKQPIPPRSKQAVLTVTPSDGRAAHEWRLNLGHMDPVATNTGVQAILNNLGYDAGENDGTIDDQFKGALLAFQSDHGLEPTGELDEDTRAALAG